MIAVARRENSNNTKFCFYVFIILRSLTVCANEYDVYKAITAKYDKNVRPTHNTSKATVVSAAMTELHFFNMDQVQQTITFTTTLKLIWNDEIAHWNSSAFGGTESVRIPSNILWKPDLYFFTSLSSENMMPEEQRFLQVLSNGTVRSESPFKITSICALSIESFPFDQQSCYLSLGPWVYPSIEVDMVSAVSTYTINDVDFKGNGEWKLLSLNANVSHYTWEEDGILKEYVQLIYTLVLKRHPSYYICVLLIPTLMSTTICICGLFVPASSTGERIEKLNMGMATLLSMAIILGIVAGEMPKSSTLPLLGFYVLAELLLCTFGIGISMLIMLAHQRAATRVLQPPSWLTTIILFKPKNCIKPERKLKLKRMSSIEKSTEPPNKCHQINDSAESVISTIIAKRLNQILDKVDKDINEKKFEDQILLYWIIIFDRIDIIFMVVFNIVNVVMSGVILLS